MTKPWLRLYRDALYKPKVGRLTLEEKGFWAVCLMASDDAGGIPSIPDLAWTLRLQEHEVSALMLTLDRNGLVTRYVTGNVTKYVLHDWDEHQRKSDHDDRAAERQRKWRERQKSEKTAIVEPVTDRNALRNATVTPLDTDTDTEKKEVLVRVAAPPKSRGSRWPADAVVSEDWIAEGEAYRDTANLQAIDLRTEALKFANYWASKSGGGATKIDWKRTWLNWCMTAKGTGHGKPNGGKSQLEVLADIARNGLHPDRGQ